MSQTLTGKTVLITGGSRGLGAEIAWAMAAEGADVAISYVASAEKAQAVVEEIRQKGVRAIAIQSDQADPSASKKLVADVLAEFGKLDILVNNAAIAIQGKLTGSPDYDAAEMDKQWQVNLLGAIATTRAAAEKLTDGGRIIFIGSGFGTRIPFGGVADYAATKVAIAGYAKGVARDLGPRNITVNVVQPGIMPTDMAAEAAANLPDAIMDMHAIRRIARLEEVAGAAVYFASPSASYTTGSILEVSGGIQI